MSALSNVNFYDPGLRHRFDWLAPLPAAAMLAAVLLATGTWVLTERAQSAALRPQAEQLSAELARVQAEMQAQAQRRQHQQPDPTLQAALVSARQALQLRQSALAQLQPDTDAQPTSHAATLAALARQSTEGLWLTGLALKDRDISLQGRALDPALIPTYVQKLNLEPALRGRSFRSLQVERPVSTAANLPSTTPPQQAPAAASSPPPRAQFVEFALRGQRADAAERSAPVKDQP